MNGPTALTIQYPLDAHVGHARQLPDIEVHLLSAALAYHKRLPVTTACTLPLAFSHISRLVNLHMACAPLRTTVACSRLLLEHLWSNQLSLWSSQ